MVCDRLDLMTEVKNEYIHRTQKSQKMYQLAKIFLPGGDARTVTFFEPYPAFIVKGKGYQLYDADGNNYIDFLNNYTSLIHGHCHPKIIKAIKEQLESIQAIHAPTEYQVKFAEMISERFPSVDKIRIMNSGTEATMNAIRLARAYTGKDKILKAEGGYHGTHNNAQISIHPHLEDSNPLNHPKSIPESKGIPKSTLKDVVIFPFNHQQITENLIKEHKKELAAVIIEPVMGAAGIIPPKDDYLKFLREITNENDVLLIFDEVITARLSRGGAQQYFNVIPDITAFGKLFGGGTPVGVLGGRDEIMMLYSPERTEFLSQSGTFNANPVTLVGGIATFELLNDSAYTQLNSLGNSLKDGISDTFKEFGINAQVTGEGSLLNMHFTEKDVIDYRSASTSNVELCSLLYLSMLNHGIWIAPRLMSCISTPMSKKEIEAFLEVFRASFSLIKPLIRKLAPSLVAK